MQRIENSQRQRAALQHFYGVSRKDKPHGRADLYDVRFAVVEVDDGDIHARKRFLFAEREQFIDGGQYGCGGHFRTVKTFQKRDRTFRNTPRVFAATHAVGERDEVGKAMADNPRTAIGIVDECHYLLIVSDGRTRESEGLTLYELAEFAKKLGVTTAYNLDGGGSSTMYFNGEVVNNPTTNGKTISERGVSDIVYIGY